MSRSIVDDHRENKAKYSIIGQALAEGKATDLEYDMHMATCYQEGRPFNPHRTQITLTPTETCNLGGPLDIQQILGVKKQMTNSLIIIYISKRAGARS